MAKRGKPALLYDPKVGDEICERLTNGESLRRISADSHIPAASTIFKWLIANEGFAEQYARAREAQADTLADEIIDIADDTEFDTTTGKDGGEVANTEWISRSKLRVDARKWVAAKLKPKKYGDKLDLTSGGEKLGLSAEVEAARRRVASGEA